MSFKCRKQKVIMKRKCTIKDCDNFQHAKSYCKKHYNQLKNQNLVGSIKKCTIKGC